MHLELERFEGSGERKVALIFSPIHLSQKEELEKVFGTIRKEHNDVEIVCLSSLAGVILDGSIRKDAVVGFVLSGVKEVLVVKRGEIEKAAYKLKEYDVGFALAFSDYDSSPLLEELTELLEDVNIPIAGGVASDDFTLKDTYLIYEGSLVKDAVLILLFKKGKEISLDWNTVVEDTGIRLRLGERRGRLLKDINGMPVNVFYEIFLQQEKGKGFLNHTFISPSYESVYRKIVYDALFMDEEGLHFAKSVDRVKEMNVGMVSKALHQYLIEKIGPFFESIDQRFMVLYCAGRLASLGEASKKEIEKYKRAIGFLSYGEVVTYNRKALFLNWSCVYLFFESSIHLPPVEPDTTPLELTRRFTELGQILTDLFMKDMVMAVVDMNENLIFYNKMLSFLFDSEEDIKDYLVRWSKSAKEKKKTTSRIHHLQSKSKNFYFRVYSIPYRDFIILTIEDFTKYASLEILERNLRINPITGLPTRHSIQYENKASCFTLDIQNFGSISLYYSEDIANQLLTEVSSILSDYAHSFNLMLYHTGIDEFTLISKDLVLYPYPPPPCSSQDLFPFPF